MDLNEKVIKKSHPHPLNFIGFYILGVMFFILAFYVSWLLAVVGVLALLLSEAVRLAETFYILESGVAREYHLLSSSREYAEYEKIQNLEVTQSFLDNILGIGSVRMDTSGGDQTEVNFNGIKDPYGIESVIRERLK